MFETAELGQKVDKQKYAEELPRLREALLDAQAELLASKRFSMLVLVNGVDGAGKGETVNLLNEWMDPRHIGTHAAREYTDEEKERPELWRYWRDLPPKGRIGIFFGSWYTMPILRRAWGELKQSAFDEALDRIVSFERMLAQEDVVVLKLWFHLSKKQQRKRLTELEGDPLTRWRVSPEDWAAHERYEVFRPICERAVRRTSTGEAPWHVIEGWDARYRGLTAGRLVVDALRARLDAKPASAPKAKAKVIASSAGEPGERTLLDALEEQMRAAAKPRGKKKPSEKDEEAAEKEYEAKLEALSGRLAIATRHKRFRKRSVIAVFEGVDAAGKGGAIRRVTRALDARHYRVVPIAAPSDEERARPYLWRFWRHVPPRGRVLIFDRSWYGRVLVERVEGFCSEADWQRAYGEINEFEEELTENGAIVVKLWLHIDQAEQKKRFEERAKTGFKRFKITDEDWRNREKWPAYAVATNEMFERTSTELAPWTLVPANDKRVARLTVMQTLIERIEHEID